MPDDAGGARSPVPDRKRIPGEAGRLRVRTAGRCWRIAWDTGSPRSSRIIFWAGSSRRRTPFFPKSCSGRRSRIWRPLWRVWTASWNRSGAWPKTTSTMEAWRRPARRSRPSCTSWPAAIGKARAWSIRGCATLFTRESVLASDWYRERLRIKQDRDIALWRRHLAALEAFRSSRGNSPAAGIDIEQRLATAREQLSRAGAAAYLDELAGTIGADPFHRQIAG